MIIGNSPAIVALRENIAKLSRNQAPLYISGPSGSGKELVAKTIHQNGTRSDQPFVPINCGAISPDLFESEFFGHKKGSFTGATQDKIGFFQAADKGTLFLDEIADLSLAMQVKLLRAIQEKAIRPVGSPTEVSVDVRLLCATHKDLHALMNNHLFRHDLFYRLNVIELKVPALQSRAEDIPLLAEHILNTFAQQANTPLRALTQEALITLCQYDFPGNVRELENILERAFTLSEGQHITIDDLQLQPPAVSEAPPVPTPPRLALDTYLFNVERHAILEVLTQSKGNKSLTAKVLGVSFRTLRYRLKKLGLN